MRKASFARTLLLWWIAGCTALAAWSLTVAITSSDPFGIEAIAGTLVFVPGAWLLTLLARRSDSAATAYGAWTAGVLLSNIAAQFSPRYAVPWAVTLVGIAVLSIVWWTTRGLIVDQDLR